MAASARALRRQALFEPHGEIGAESESTSSYVPWGIWTALGAFVLAFIIYALGDTILALIAKGLYDRDTIIFSIVAYQFLGLGVAVCVVWLVMERTGADLSMLGFRFPGMPTLVRAFLALVPIFIGVALISAAFSTFLPGYHLQGNAKQELPVGHHVNTARAVLILVWAAVEAPLVEETLFRGIIFQGISRFAGRWLNHHLAVLVGAVVSGFIFGLAHFEPHTLPILVFLGIALAYVFYYSRSIYASMLVHGTVNAIAAISVLHGQ
jgi:membrane protease YdiL (CAAX protease family)